MHTKQRGMSLMEALVGLAILSTMIVITVTTTSTALKLTKNNVNKEFGTQKAISMLEELRSLVQTASGATLTFLDAYDNGIDTSYVLTTQGQLQTSTLPNDIISGNVLKSNGKWLYERRISVQPVPGQGNDVRFVNVKVFINEDNGQRLLAEVASVLRTLVVNTPQTQVYDVYAVAIENVPGWWVYMSNIVPFVRTTIADLQARNPGLVFRTHWINTLSYGRDWQYKPYINDTKNNADNPSTNDIDWAYFYPGKMPTGQSDDYYYPWFLFKAVMNKDGSDRNGYDAVNNPWPYAIADQFNNAMRYEDELAYYKLRKAANADEELTWRLLIEKMYSSPGEFTNAIVINLHGELLPFPPVRNYSDPAKSPETYPNVRAVTHPEQLRYDHDDDVKLRVYTYVTNPDAAGDDYFGESGTAKPIMVTVKGLTGTWSPAASDVQVIRGGTDQDGTAGSDAYDFAPVDAPTSSSASNRMYYTPSPGAGTTTLKLFYSPLKHGQDVGGATPVHGGLNSRDRLYGLEYIPSSVDDLTATDRAAQFSRHLGWVTGTVRDDFASAAYNLNTGLVKWIGNWTEVNDETTATAGVMTVTSGRLQISDNGNAAPSTISRGADLSGYTSATLTFDASTSSVEAADTILLQISSDGVAWTTLATYTGAVSAPQRFAIPGSYFTSLFKLRFITSGTGYNSGDLFLVDNIQIADSGDVPKNTARWVLTIPAANLPDGGGVITVETRIGDDVTTGVMYPTANVPPNLSRTYVWYGPDTWINGDGTNTNPPHLPITEQFQFLGDPRHMPYADLKRPHDAVAFPGFSNSLGMGYNRYFDDLESGFDSIADLKPRPDGNVAAAELIASQENYNITNAKKTFAVKVDGAPAVSTTLVVANQSAVTIATTLNAATSPFAAVAIADVVTWKDTSVNPAVTRTNLRIRSKTRGTHSSIQYDVTTGTNEDVFGFDDTIAKVPWPGWRYVVGGTLYGVKNDDQTQFKPLDPTTYDLAAGWVDNEHWEGALDIDAHRAYQIVRSSLTQSQALWTTMTGYSYYYMGIGNEIGYDCANKFGQSIPVSAKPYTGKTGTRFEQTILYDINYNASQPCSDQPCVSGGTDICSGVIGGCGVKYIKSQAGAWWGLSWIGELYPDSQYAANSKWKINGNLQTGEGTNFFVRGARQDFPAFRGTKLPQSKRQTMSAGVTTMFWGESTDSAMHHEGTEGESTLLADGKDIANNYELPVPDTIATNRPWQIDWKAAGNNPEDFLGAAYPKLQQLQLMERYYERNQLGSTFSMYCLKDKNGVTVPTECKDTDKDGNADDVPCVKNAFTPGGQPTEGSGLVAMTDNTYQKPAFVVVNGLSPTGVTGTTFIAKWSFLTLIQSYLNAGVYADNEAPKPTPADKYRVRQLPRVSVTDPNQYTDLKNPPSVKIAWTTEYKRWDGKQYSASYLTAYVADTSDALTYVVMYSPSNGAPDPDKGNPTGWLYTDGTPATLGARNLGKGTTATQYLLSTPGGTFPEGNYVFRVEAYRNNYPLHYSFHQYRAYIQRK
jgi:type II secretory pathway pseudopilin PulG